MSYLHAALWGVVAAGFAYVARRDELARVWEPAAEWVRRVDSAAGGTLGDAAVAAGIAVAAAGAATRVGWVIGAGAVTAAVGLRVVLTAAVRQATAAVSQRSEIERVRRELRTFAVLVAATQERVEGTAGRLDSLLAEILYDDSD